MQLVKPTFHRYASMGFIIQAVLAGCIFFVPLIIDSMFTGEMRNDPLPYIDGFASLIFRREILALLMIGCDTFDLCTWHPHIAKRLMCQPECCLQVNSMARPPLSRSRPLISW